MNEQSAPDQRAYALEWEQRREPYSLHSAVTDPTASGHLARANLGLRGELLFGMIADAVPYLHAYKVLFEQGHPPCICTPLTHTSMGAFGAREASTLSPGDHVWVLVHRQLLYGLIVGVEPSHAVDPTLALSDWIHQASRSGLRIDSMHREAFKLSGKGGLQNWAANRPFDGTTAGEWGAVTETGLRVMLDSFMAQLAVDEATGVFAFYHDQMLRLCGHQFQEFSSGHLREILDDEGEISSIEGYAIYPHEQMGRFRPGDPIRQEDAKAVQIEPGHYAAFEPSDDHQRPFHRTARYQGHLGQGGHQIWTAPPQAGELCLSGEDQNLHGVCEQHVSLTGAYLLRSAHSVWIAKRAAIPAPHRRHPAEHGNGDNPQNYRAGGLQGSGPEHKVQDRPKSTEQGSGAALQSVAAMLDFQAYLWNWDAVHPFHYHKQDFHLPQESETPLRQSQAPLDFSQLRYQTYMRPPRPVRAYVDERYKQVEYFPNTSYLGMLPDGGVVLGDGYGSEIRMVGGNIYLSAAGDVVLQPGRSVVGLAGRDVVLRAKNSIDLSATDHDVRLKAQRNLQLVGGNEEGGTSGGQGGILLESRSPSAFEYEGVVGEDVVMGGIQLKAKHGHVVAWGRDVYLRTGGGDVDAGGGIVFDAGAGTSYISEHASSIVRYADYAADSFPADGSSKAVNSYSATSNLLDGPTVVDGGITVLGYGTFTGWIGVIGGHIVTELAPTYDYKVPGPGKEWGKYVADVQKTAQAVADFEDSYAAAYQEFYPDYIYADPNVGADTVIAAVTFSFRSTPQYRTEDWKLWESRWQQLVRLYGGNSDGWTETPILAGSTVTHPYPGDQAWAREERFHQQNLRYYDVAAGHAAARGEAYEDAELLRPTVVTAQSNYTILT